MPPNKLGIEIEAALAFGTGHHGTTRGCLLLLDQVLKAYRPRRVLDLGTGTGVLAIAAAKALHIKVLASDIDPLSVKVAHDNARLNGSGIWWRRSTPPASPRREFAQRGPFDLVLANILANPLRQMATPMARHLAPSALVILSGLLPHQAQRRDRRLPRARAGAETADPDRGLEQPVDAEGVMKVDSSVLDAKCDTGSREEYRARQI